MSVRRSLAIAVLASLLLSSCADDELKPDIPSPTASAPTTSATTKPVDPLAYPTEAMEPTKAGADVLIRHFWDMVNHLRETGDSKPVRKLYGPQCDYCEDGVTAYLTALNQGDVFEGGEVRQLRIRASVLDSCTGVPSVYAKVVRSTAHETQRNAQGEMVTEFPKGRSARDYFLAFQEGRWEITNVEEPQ